MMKLNVFTIRPESQNHFVRIPPEFLAMGGFKERTKVTVTIFELRSGDNITGHGCLIYKTDKMPEKPSGRISLLTHVGKNGLLQVPDPVAECRAIEVDYSPYDKSLEIRGRF